MNLQNRVGKLEDLAGVKVEVIQVDIRGNCFFINDEEISIIELKELSDKYQKIKIYGYLDDKGAELLENIAFTSDVDLVVKRYAGGVSPNDWDNLS